MYIPLKPLFSRHKGIGVQFTDEPTGNLDEDTAGEIIELLKKTAHELGKSVIVDIGYILLAEFDDTEKAILNEIMAVLQRYSAKYKCEEENIRKIDYRGLVIYPDQRRILAAENEVFLSHYEFDILLLLVNHPGWVFTREQIYEAVWDDIPVNVDAKVECMIYSIRKKLRKYTDRQYIQTVWGVGYKFDPET